jgi:hypothetical protein
MPARLGPCALRGAGRWTAACAAARLTGATSDHRGSEGAHEERPDAGPEDVDRRAGADLARRRAVGHDRAAVLLSQCGAVSPPYNRHLFHDIGAFQIGLGACLAASLVFKDALVVVLVGNACAGVAHFVAHVLDRSQGGHASDPFTFGVLAVLIVALAVARWLAVRPRPPSAAS